MWGLEAQPTEDGSYVQATALLSHSTAPSPPLPDHPDFRYSGHSSGDTRGSLGIGPAEGLIPETLVREVAIEH